MNKYMMRSRIWIAGYLYYAEPWETFLVYSVKPFAEKMLKWGLANQFFFVRYWKNGPHIRLRFGGDKNIHLWLLKYSIHYHFHNYFKKYPSERISPNIQLTQNQLWNPNNSISFCNYEPEFERYGGHVGMAIAERQFQVSSETILTVMKDKIRFWNYDLVLGLAIELNIGLLYALKIPVKEMQAIFKFVFENWVGWHYDVNKIGQKEFLLERARILEIYQRSYAREGGRIVAFVENYLNALENDIKFEQDWLNSWIDQMTDIGSELMYANQKNILNLSNNSYLEWYSSHFIDRQPLWGIIESYIHMTNNRIGVLNRDESYLGYLLHKSLERLCNTATIECH